MDDKNNKILDNNDNKDISSNATINDTDISNTHTPNESRNIEDEEALNKLQTTFIGSEILDIKNDSLSLEKQEQFLLEEKKAKEEEIQKILLEEKKQKQEETKAKRKKITKIVLKGTTVASCFLFAGIGIGIGSIFSENYISEQAKKTFKFDTTNLENNIAETNLMFTSSSASSIFKEVGDCVVNISTKSSQNFFSQKIEGSGSGSGIIYKVDNDIVYIITNNHVIENAQSVSISVTGDEQINAKLVGTDPTSDLAVLSVNKDDMTKAGIENITVATFADSDMVEVGDFVFPIGNALGRGKTMTQGMISAQNKEINIDGKNLTVLQTDAAINPGNSGGALMNSKGEVVGINTAKLASSDIEGIGYAIPANIALDISNQIIELGYVQRPSFGIVAKTITEKTKEIYGLEASGVLVIEVEQGSNAEKAGIKPTDIITSFNGVEIDTVESLSNAIKKSEINQTISLNIIRNGTEKMTLNVTLAPSNTTF